MNKNRSEKRLQGIRYFSILSALYIYLTPLPAIAQQVTPTGPGNHNPIIPGYFADPTVKKFGDTFYLYATTDGNGGGLGPSQVWTSKDFVNWTMQDMNWPNTRHYWAPDVTRANDGKYYLYYCQPTVEIYGASSSTPVGPWTPLFADGKAVVPNYLVPKVITLDGQTFRDDDGKQYMTWGTWGIYPGHGCAIGLLNSDMRSFEKTWQIPNTIAKDFFEAPFLFKRKGIYYLMYSSGLCEDGTYRVQYATSKTGPAGKFSYGKHNPILATNDDGTVHGPGHNSVIQVGQEYYIVYHRHNNPHSGGGYHRQVCADKIIFDREGNIERIKPTHSGVGHLGKNTIPYQDLALGKKVMVSSAYEGYKPEYAVDNNNGTLWKPANNSTNPAWIEIDLGKPSTVKTILTQFEYATWAYQYRIEYAVDDQKNWRLFSDKTHNNWHGSPYVDEGDVKAKHIRMTITGTGQPGLYKALWNIKIFSEAHIATMPPNLHSGATAEVYKQNGLLVDLDTETLPVGEKVGNWKNRGQLGGGFKASEDAPMVGFIGGRKAVVFNGNQMLSSDFAVPSALSGNNSFTVLFWVNTGYSGDENPLLSWSDNSEPLSSAVFGFGNERNLGAVRHNGFSDMGFKPVNRMQNQWHHVAFTFDGTFEKLFIDGELNNEENKMLFIKLARQFTLGGTGKNLNNFKGAISSLQVYDGALSTTDIVRLYGQVQTDPVAVYLDAAKLSYGKLQSLTNEGSLGGVFQPQHDLPVVKDMGGRISLTFTVNQRLKLDKPWLAGSNRSVVSGEYISVDRRVRKAMMSKAKLNLSGSNRLVSGTWHYVVTVYQDDTVKKYVDGKLDSSYRLAASSVARDSITFGHHGNFTDTLAIAGLQIYTDALTEQQIAILTRRWLDNLHSPVMNVPVYKYAPKAISPQMATMEAAAYDIKGDLEYNFIRISASGARRESGWQSNPVFADEALLPDHSYHYAYKVRDVYGNVSKWSVPAKVNTASSAFSVIRDDFSGRHDYLTDGLNGTIWDGLLGKGDRQSADSVLSEVHRLTLSSAATNWDGKAPYGPFLYKDVSGNFVAEVEVSDFTGLGTRKTVGNIDAGLMVRLDKPLSGTQELLQNSIFPAWSVGNLVTNVNHGGRQQTNNHSAWNFEPFIQIERNGDWFYLRSSSDNVHWHNLPGSPVLRNDFKDKSVQVGLYQSTYGPYKAYGTFKNFRLITPGQL